MYQHSFMFYIHTYTHTHTHGYFWRQSVTYL